MELFDEVEVWKDIEGYEGMYQVSNMGLVWSVEREIVMPKGGIKKLGGLFIIPDIIHNGYYQIKLYKNGKYKRILLSRLVAIHFIPNPLNLPQVNHKKGNKSDNRASQLEWCTASENVQHAFDILGRKPIKGLKHYSSIEVLQISLDGFLIGVFISITEAHIITSIRRGHIGKCVNGERKTAGGYIWR